MVNAGWLVPAMLVGVIIGALVIGSFAGAKEPKCTSCVLMLKNKYDKPKQSKLKVDPPPKHPWELVHADRLARNLYQKNGRRDRIK